MPKKLTQAQRRALTAARDGGGKLRNQMGRTWTSVDGHQCFQDATVYALQQRGLLSLRELDAVTRITEAGRAVLETD